jgi:ankyrin repeat protein
MNKTYHIKNRFLKNIALGILLLGTFAGTGAQLHAVAGMVGYRKHAKKQRQKDQRREAQERQNAAQRNEALNQAIQNNNLRAVTKALQQGADPNAEYDFTPLLLKAILSTPDTGDIDENNQYEDDSWEEYSYATNPQFEQMRVKIVQELLKYKADPCRMSRVFSGNLLHYTDNPEIIDILCKQYKVDVNALNRYGKTPLQLAVEKPKNIECIKKLLECGARIDQNVCDLLVSRATNETHKDHAAYRKICESFLLNGNK